MGWRNMGPQLLPKACVGHTAFRVAAFLLLRSVTGLQPAVSRGHACLQPAGPTDSHQRHLFSIAVDLLPSCVWPGRRLRKGMVNDGSRSLYVFFVSVFLRSGKHAAGYDQEVDHGQGFWFHSRRAWRVVLPPLRLGWHHRSKSCAKARRSNSRKAAARRVPAPRTSSLPSVTGD